MTDYCEALNDPRNPYYREANSLANKLRTEATITAEVIRWNSNGRVPPSDVCEFAEYIGLPISLTRCAIARERETAEFLASYRRNPPKVSAEDRAEMRAAFGPGATVVNVITGRKTRV